MADVELLTSIEIQVGGGPIRVGTSSDGTITVDTLVEGGGRDLERDDVRRIRDFLSAWLDRPASPRFPQAN